MRLGSRSQVGRLPRRVCRARETSSCETSPPQRRLLWWTHERRETSPSDHPPRGNYPLPGSHVPLPLGQQVRPLPGGTSRHSERRDTHRHWRLFWTLSSDHRPTLWIVPSRLTVLPRGKIVVYALSYVRGVGNGETASQTIGPLPPYRCSARLTRYVCTPEVKEAVERGYRIVCIHEVWNFPERQRRTKLFKDYVDTWLKLKTEASGYPRWAQTDMEKQVYRERYEAREGIVLSGNNIEKNPGRKATAKLMLNSFWGKFGENLCKTSTQTVTTPAQLYALVSDPTLDITNLRICTDVLEVCFQKHEDETVENGRTNIFIACFTTCHARLKLYTYLKQLGEQVLYFDIDSVIYSHVGNQPSLENGDYLGDLTDKLDPGQTIVDFTSGGPKNYGYRTTANKTECKVRGFSLQNLRGSAQLNYDILRTNVLDELTDPLPDETTTAGHTPRQTIWTCFRQARCRHDHLHIVSLWIFLTSGKKKTWNIVYMD